MLKQKNKFTQANYDAMCFCEHRRTEHLQTPILGGVEPCEVKGCECRGFNDKSFEEIGRKQYFQRHRQLPVK